jgi:hypothetical protein
MSTRALHRMMLIGLCAGLVLAVVSSALGMAGTDQVAQKGKPVEMESGWPAGVLQIINDELRTGGTRPWFTECPNDVTYYGLAIRDMDDVNRLVQKLAVIDADAVKLCLCAEAGATQPGEEGATFSLGNQETLDAWYARLPEAEPGVRQFGVHRYDKPPRAQPPTIFVWVNHRTLDLDKLRIPLNVDLTATMAEEYRAKHKDLCKKIDELIESHTSRQKETLASGKWLSSALDEIQKIKQGMSREELEKVFRDDGGELRDRRQYAFRDCPHIKVTVYFEAPSAADGKSETDWSKDKIASISKPFLE